MPIIGNVIAYYAIKSYNNSEKAKLEATIGLSLDGIKGDLKTLSKKPEQPELRVSQHKKRNLSNIKKLFSRHEANKTPSALPNNTKSETIRRI